MSNSPLLDGLNVLDFTIAMAGPLATQRLAEMGANIVKIETPRTGDLTRSFAVGGANIDGQGAAYFALNHNKKSIAINLKHPEAGPLMDRLFALSDVVVQNFRPDVADRIGIGYERVRSVRKDIVYVSISGYGDLGPMAKSPGQDLLVQSFSGLTFNAGSGEDEPHPAPVFLVDTTASHLATSAVLAALVHRERTGAGDHVKVSLLAAALEMQCQELAAFVNNGKRNQRVSAPYASAWLEPPYGIYGTADGWVAFAQNDLGLIARTLDNAALAALAHEAASGGGDTNSPQWKKWREDVYFTLATSLKTMTTDAIVTLLGSVGVWCGPVHDYGALFDHPQSAGHFREVKLRSGASMAIPRPAIQPQAASVPEFSPPPNLGENTDEILGWAGFLPDEVASMRTQGLVS